MSGKGGKGSRGPIWKKPATLEDFIRDCEKKVPKMSQKSEIQYYEKLIRKAKEPEATLDGVWGIVLRERERKNRNYQKQKNAPREDVEASSSKAPQPLPDVINDGKKFARILPNNDVNDTSGFAERERLRREREAYYAEVDPALAQSLSSGTYRAITPGTAPVPTLAHAPTSAYAYASASTLAPAQRIAPTQIMAPASRITPDPRKAPSTPPRIASASTSASAQRITPEPRGAPPPRRAPTTAPDDDKSSKIKKDMAMSRIM